MARITALRPGASPPPVVMAMRMPAPAGRLAGERTPDSSGPGRLPGQADDLARFGVPPEGTLGEDEASVQRYLEHAAG